MLLGLALGVGEAEGGVGGGSVEHDGLRILVHHLGHVSQNVLLGDDAQETPEMYRSATNANITRKKGNA